MYCKDEYYYIDGWSSVTDPYYILNDDSIIYLKDDFIDQNIVDDRIIRHYKHFDTIVYEKDGKVYFELEPVNDLKFREILWPPCFECKGNGYTTIPYLQGMIVPNDDDKDYSKLAFDGQFCSCAAYMPWIHQKMDDEGYIVINMTPWDAKYKLLHGDGHTYVQFRWLSSLGYIAYKRKLCFEFKHDMDYNEACKIYRRYVMDNGHFKSLKDKIKRTPSIAKLIECSVVHTGIKSHIDETSDMEKVPDHINRFDSVEKMIQTLHDHGAKKLYLHLDGWGEPGYDNCHPDYLPPCLEAGGWEGLLHLNHKLHESNDLFGLHDQYRDYYLKAKTYDINNALQSADGTCFEMQRWAGGKQNYLCASLALDYVKRNFNELFEHGMKLDCSYLDVFTCNELDECFNHDHLMTRKECMLYRNRCFEYLLDNGIIPSSEECTDWSIPSLVFSHYGPYEFMLKDDETKLGIPVPLFNLVYHDAFILPWPMDKRNEDYMLYALLNGGMPYLLRNAPYMNIDGNFGDDELPIDEKIKRANIVSNFYQLVYDQELTKHEIVSDHEQKSYFKNGYSVYIDLENNYYEIDKTN